MEPVILTLGILFFFALIGSVLASRFKQPILLGLLLVGAIIGPYTLGIIKDTGTINMMIDVGAILMLFMIGLQFDISKLKKIGLKALVVGLL
jgi:monovalent cation:H+ antiporter-2, CPA2 family